MDALIVIDVHRLEVDPNFKADDVGFGWNCDGGFTSFSGNARTHAVASRINVFTHEARVRNIPVIFLFYAEENEDLYVANGGPYIVDPLDTDIVLTKTEMSGFEGSDLETVLRSMNIQRPGLCGFRANGCVSFTALDAKDLGFDPIVLADICGQKCPHDHRAAMAYLVKHGVNVSTTANALYAHLDVPALTA